MSTARKLMLLAGGIGLCALIALTLLTGADVISATAAVVIGALAVVLAFQLLTVVSIRRVDGKALRIDNRVKRYETEMAKVKASTERLDRRLDEIVTLLGSREVKYEEDLQAILVSLGEHRLISRPQRRHQEGTPGLLPCLDAAEARSEAEGKA